MDRAEELLRLEKLVENVCMTREGLFDRLCNGFNGPNRMVESCGYPVDSELNPEYYRTLYDNDPIAARVIELMPKECWQSEPTIVEDIDSEEDTPFEQAWDELSVSLRGGQSWYKDEAGSPVWEHLRRIDIMSCIGYFGLLLIGIDDGMRLDEPVQGVVEYVGTQKVGEPLVDNRATRYGNDTKAYPSRYTEEVTVNRAGQPFQNDPAFGFDFSTAKTAAAQGTDRQYDRIGSEALYAGIELGPAERLSDEPSKQKRKLLYLRCFDESLVQPVQYEADMRNPRFAMPVAYRVTLNDPRTFHSGIGLPLATVRVHWSRVIHVPSENLLNSESFATPMLKQVLRPVIDATKVRGSGSEGYFKSCFPGISLETHPQLGGDVDVPREQINQMMTEYYAGLQRTITLMGMSAKTLPPSVVDPTPHLAAAYEAICIRIGCPVRVFKGSERGEQASSQDDDAWLDRVGERRLHRVNPKIIVPFVDRLISMGVLPEPKQWHCKWPGLEANSDTVQAQIALTKTQTVGAYVSGNCESVLPAKRFFVEYMGEDPDEVDDFLDEAKESSDTMTMPPPGAQGHPATTPPKPTFLAPPLKPGASLPKPGASLPKPPQQPKPTTNGVH